MNKTFVLIHGAGDSSANWAGVAAELRARGHDVVAPDLPCEEPDAGLADYADAVVEAIGDRTGLVVVAHSLGGFTAPLVCARVPADLLVLCAGMIPAPGETFTAWWGATGHAIAPGADWNDETALFIHDAPADVAAAALARSRDQADKPLGEPWPLAAWPDVPTRYLLFRDDRCFPAEWARRHARERLGIEADAIDGSHMAYVSRPAEVAARLDAYAR